MSEKQIGILQQTSGFNMSHEVRYLEITLTKHCSSLLAKNHVKFFNQIKDLKVWQKQHFLDGKNSFSKNGHFT